MAKTVTLKALLISVIIVVTLDLPRVCSGQREGFRKETVLHYDFDTNCSEWDVCDKSGHGSNATITDIDRRNGHCGQGIYFGNESLLISENSRWQMTKGNRSSLNLTMAAWIFLKEAANGSDRRAIFTSFHEGSKKRFIYFGLRSMEVRWFVDLNGTGQDARKTFKFRHRLKLGYGVWYHLAVSYTFSNGEESCVFFVNGSRRVSKATKKSISDTSITESRFLGSKPQLGGVEGNKSLKGIMDDFYIFNKTLTEEDIRKVMNGSCEVGHGAPMHDGKIKSPTYKSTVLPPKTLSPVQQYLSKAETITNKEEAKTLLSKLVEDRLSFKNISKPPGSKLANAPIKRTKELEKVALILAQNTLKANETISLDTENAFLVLKKPWSSFTFSSPELPKSKDIKESISFPDDMVKIESGERRAFVCMAYPNLHENIPRFNLTISGDSVLANSTFKLNSKIIGAAVDPPLEKSLINRIKITFTHPTNSGEQVCAFWNHSIRTTNETYGQWSASGCTRIHSTSTETVCSCDHLTNFALLLRRDDGPVRDPPLSLTIITIIGCTLSILSCFLCLIMFLTVKKKDVRHYLHINLIIAIALAQLILLFGITRTKYTILCKVTAVLLHYFYLAAFLFTLCEGIHLAILIETAFTHGDIKLPVYLIASWGIPLLIVGITLGVRFDNYGGKTACFISASEGTVYAFLGPFAVVLLVNFVVLVIVLRQVIKKTSLPISSKCATKFEIVRATIRSLIILFPVMGFTWIFGILYFAFRSLVLAYLFAIFCTLQGFFVFLLQYALNTENRNAFMRATRRWRLTFSSSRTSGSDTRTTESKKATLGTPGTKEEGGVATYQDNCHLIVYRTADDKRNATLDSRTASTYL